METNNLIDLDDVSLIIYLGQDTKLIQTTRSFFEYLLKFTYIQNKNSFLYKRDNNLLEKFTQSIEFLNTKKIPYQLSQSAEEYRKSIQIEQSDFEKRLQEATKIKNKIFDEISLVGFQRTLKKYQSKGYSHLISMQNGANFSVPGSGKTTVSYAYYKHLLENKIIDKLLVIGPRSSFVPWEEEFELCFDKKPSIQRFSGNILKREQVYNSVENYDIFLITYQTASNDIEELISICKKFKFLVILDESHYIKRITKGYWATQLLKLAPYATRRVILTGTPAPNSYEDLWSQVNFLWPNKNILGNPAYFKSLNKNNQALESIKNTIYPLFFRTSKKDLLLPEPKFINIELDLAQIQKRIYTSLAIKYLAELKEQPMDIIKLRQWRKAKIIRLIQAATNPALLSKYSDEFKLPPLDGRYFALTDLIEKYADYEIPPKYEKVLSEIKNSVKEGHKIIIWTNFIQNIKTLSKMLKNEDISFARVYGEIPKDFSDDEEDNREKEIQKFKMDKNVFVLLANPAACSESISLHKVCKEAIYFDRSFNCGQYLQSLDRIHRLGLSENDEVIYKLLISRGTIDEVIDQRLVKKSKTMENLLSSDISLGSFDVDATDIIGNENEEAEDFDATIQDLLNRYKTDK